jgi:hypothetical protein
MESQTEERIHSLCVGWRNLFSSCAVVLCQFLVLAGNAETHSTLFSGRLFWNRAGNSFLVLRTYLVYNTVVWLCQFFVVVGKLILFEYLTVTIVSQKYRELSL